MNKYPYLKAAFTCLYSGEPYRDAALRWSGYGFKYLFIVSILVCLYQPITSIWQLHAKHDGEEITKTIMQALFVEGYSDEENLNRVLNILSQVPNITVNKSNNLVIDKEYPYSIKDPFDGKTIVIFDHDGQNLTENALLVTPSYVAHASLGSVGSPVFSLYKEFINPLMKVLGRIPLIKIQNSKATTSKQQPYTIESEAGRKLLSIDTKNELIEDDALVQIKRDRVEFSNNRFSPIAFSDITYDFVYQKVSAVVERIPTEVTKFIFLFMPITIVVFFAAISLLVMGLSLLVNQLSGRLGTKNLGLKGSLRLTSIAITPSLFVQVVFPFEMKALAHLVMHSIITGTYIYFALQCIKNAKK